MIDISIYKLKYRNPDARCLHRQGVDPPQGTWTYRDGGFATKPRTNTGRKAGATLRPRRKAYGPF